MSIINVGLIYINKSRIESKQFWCMLIHKLTKHLQKSNTFLSCKLARTMFDEGLLACNNKRSVVVCLLICKGLIGKCFLGWLFGNFKHICCQCFGTFIVELNRYLPEDILNFPYWWASFKGHFFALTDSQ